MSNKISEFEKYIEESDIIFNETYLAIQEKNSISKKNLTNIESELKNTINIIANLADRLAKLEENMNLIR